METILNTFGKRFTVKIWVWPMEFCPSDLFTIDDIRYSTVTDFAKFRGWSTSVPFTIAT